MPTKRSSRLFLLISLVIALSDSVFVWLNYRSAQNALYASLEQEIVESRAAFRLAMDSTTDMLQQMAAFVAANPKVQQLFLAGKQAIEAEGGGAGGAQAAAARQALLRLVQPGWAEMTQKFDVRQLHFHLGPGSLSFLRVHRPDKFGDRMDHVRYTIVAANDSKHMTRGFETGRVYSGLRGVAPVFADDPETGERIHVGALEAGTSFQNLFDTLQHHSDTQFAVLLTPGHLKANVWPEFLKRLYQQSPPVAGLFIEATQDRESTRLLLSQMGIATQIQSQQVVLFERLQKPLAAQAFELRDFQGNQQADYPIAGYVLQWKEASTLLQRFHETLLSNIFFAIAAFVVLEIILFFGIRMVTRHLQSEVDHKTHELHQANSHLDQRNHELVESMQQLQRAQEMLVQSEKLAALGGLVAGVAHEINTPVGVGITAASTLQEQVASIQDKLAGKGISRADLDRFVDSTAQVSDMILNNLRRTAELVGSFKQVAADQTSESRRRFELCRYLQEIIQSLSPTIRKSGHEVKIECSHAIEMDSYPGALSQVISNLVMNALVHAFAEGQHGQIVISAQMLDSAEVALHCADNGRGIAAADRAQIFNPFFTTRRDSGGTGLGLSIVHNLVSGRLQGHIQLNEANQTGSEFILKLPLHLDG